MVFQRVFFINLFLNPEHDIIFFVEQDYIVSADFSQKRLDDFLVFAADMRKSRTKKYIERKALFCNSVLVTKSGKKVREGDKILLQEEENTPLHSLAHTLPSVDILFQNDSVLAVKKPPFLVTHPDRHHQEDSLVQRLQQDHTLSPLGSPDRPGIVHRLDKDTSGVILVAKTEFAHIFLQKSFAGRKVEKSYLTLVHGHVPSSGTIDAPIIRDPRNRQKMTTSSQKSARHARSHFELLERFQETSLLRISIETGRTHQIRVHMADIGHPVCFDPLYGNPNADDVLKKKYLFSSPRIFLHAERLTLVLPGELKKRDFSLPLWDDLEKILRKIREENESL